MIKQFPTMEMYYLIGKNVMRAADMNDWAENFRHTHVGLTQIGEYIISTVFTGLDARSVFESDESVREPRIFETMVFVRGHGEEDKTVHSCKWEDALRVHKLICWEHFDMMSEED